VATTSSSTWTVISSSLISSSLEDSEFKLALSATVVGGVELGSDARLENVSCGGAEAIEKLLFGDSDMVKS
jgi:hypothetical protein